MLCLGLKSDSSESLASLQRRCAKSRSHACLHSWHDAFECRRFEEICAAHQGETCNDSAWEFCNSCVISRSGAVEFIARHCDALFRITQCFLQAQKTSPDLRFGYASMIASIIGIATFACPCADLRFSSVACARRNAIAFAISLRDHGLQMHTRLILESNLRDASTARRYLTQREQHDCVNQSVR